MSQININFSIQLDGKPQEYIEDIMSLISCYAIDINMLEKEYNSFDEFYSEEDEDFFENEEGYDE